ncbi:hypothetical protein NF27_DT01720 [Candidatus Jidaibacter acanthamoeba]|uniref:Uncharacterized protein n=1 Tax=Candidatus Jidaibacter acanthamoebae TaxID=86105 RepID=A0A0C1QMX7_9RICK|nr:hypothetical protein [Candidatus Jidaibacter acanthamoeba]KIE05398.1 hypothetical protein NF27_DT01720 [Candidatus Jidaibacter acanthamoeba]
MKYNIINLTNTSHLALAALALLEANNLGIISSELFSSLSTTQLYPALAVGTMILGGLNYYRSIDNLGKCLVSFGDKYLANISNYCLPLAETMMQEYENNNDRKLTINNIEKLVPLAGFFALTTSILGIGYLPLLCFTSMLHFNFNEHNKFIDTLLKNNIPEEHLKTFNQDSFASRVLNKLSSTLMLQ